MRFYVIVTKDILDKCDKGSELFDEEVYSKLKALGQIQGGLTLGTHRTSLDKSKVMLEINGVYINTAKDVAEQEEQKFQPLVDENILIAYGHYPHLGIEHASCIFCYLEEHKEEWQN